MCVWEEAHGAGIATLFLRVGFYPVPSMPTIVEATMFEKLAARFKKEEGEEPIMHLIVQGLSCLCTLVGEGGNKKRAARSRRAEKGKS